MKNVVVIQSIFSASENNTAFLIFIFLVESLTLKSMWIKEGHHEGGVSIWLVELLWVLGNN